MQTNERSIVLPPPNDRSVPILPPGMLEPRAFTLPAERNAPARSEPAFAAPTSRLLDRSLAAASAPQKVEATGQLTVDVRAPKGTSVKAQGGGLFNNKIRLNRGAQMQPSSGAGSKPKPGFLVHSPQIYKIC